MDVLRLPQRIVLSIMAFLGVTVAFATRACLSVAITEMIVMVNKTSHGNEFSVCQSDAPSTNLSVVNSHFTYGNVDRFNWSEEQQGWIFSSLYAGYLVTHIPGALLAEKIGGKWMLSLSVLFTAICNAATPEALLYGGYNALILLRVLMGLVGGVIFPSLSVLLAAWIPEKERGKLGSLAFSGSQVGNLVSFYLSGLILSYQPWPIVFYFWSVISIIWLIIFMLICSKDPASHPFITNEELNYLKHELGELKRRSDLPPTPWKSILTSTPVLALIISQMGNDCVWVTIATDLPKYMKEVVGFSVDRAGFYSALSCLFMWIISIISGFLCDYLIEHQFLTIVQARKLFTILSSFTTVLLVAASYAGCDRLLVVSLITLAMGFFGNYYPGMRVNSLDLSPNYTGSIMSIVNGSGSISGFIFPTFIGLMIPDSSLEQWRTVFWTILGIAIVRVTVFSIWASGEVQPWNNPKELKSRECDKLTDETEDTKDELSHGIN